MRGSHLTLRLATSAVHVLVLTRWQIMDSAYVSYCTLGCVLNFGSLPHNGVADINTIIDAVSTGQ